MAAVGEAYKPDMADDLVQSDALEAVGAGVEALGRGIMPKGTFNALERDVGGATQEQIDARATKYPVVSAANELAGTAVRDVAAFATGGASAMYGLAALNTIGATAEDPTVNHDIGLATEKIAGHLFGELLSTTVGLGIGQAAAVGGNLITAAGRAVMQGSVGVGTKLLGEKLAGAGVALNDVRSVVESAMKNGVFTKARAAALDHSEKVIAEVSDHIATYLAPVDAVAARWNPAVDNRAVRQAVLGTIDETAKRLSPAESQGAIAKLQSLRESFASETGNVTPSKLLEYEAALKAAAKGESGPGATALYGAQSRVSKVTDAFLNDLNTPAQELRQLQQELVAQQGIKAAIPNDAVRGAAKAAAKGGAAAGLGYVANELGVGEMFGEVVPPAIIHGGEGMLLGALGIGLKNHGGKIAGDLAKAGVGGAATGAYAAGEALSQFDKEFFGQYYANHVGNELGKQTFSALRGATSAASQAILPPQTLEKLQTWAANPQSFRQAMQENAEGLPLTDEHKADIVDQASCLLTHVAKLLPQCSPYAPPGARSIPVRRERQIADALQAIGDPEGQLRTPTKTGVDTLGITHPKTKGTMVQLILDDLGPNTPPAGEARRLVDGWGGDAALKEAGRAAQQNYNPQPAPAATQRRRQGGSNNTTINIEDDVSTGMDNVQKGVP